MRIIVGEVAEKDGNYKMARAVHIEVPDDCLDLEPKEFAKQFLLPAAVQLLAWRKEEVDHAKSIVESVTH